MFRWEDISYRNGAIREKGVESLGVLARTVQSSLGMTSQPGVIFLSLGVSFVVAHFTGSPSFGQGAAELAEDTQSLRSGIHTHTTSSPLLGFRPCKPVFSPSPGLGLELPEGWVVIAQGFLIPLNPPGSPARATKTPMSLSIYSIPAGTWQRVRPATGPGWVYEQE